MTDPLWTRLCGTGMLAALAGVALAATPAEAQETFELSGGAAAIWNLAGTVTVTGGGSALTVDVRRGGADGARLEVATGRVDLSGDGGGPVDGLRILYPSDDIVYEGSGGTEVSVQDDGTFYDGGRGGRRVRIRDTGSGIDAHADLTVRVPKGRSLRVYLAVGGVTVSNVEGDLVVSVGSADIRSTGTSGRLVLDTGSGDVDVDGASGDVNVDTGSGDVHARDVSGGDVWFDTGSGDVVAESVKAAAVGVDTGSGDVRLSGLEAPELSVDTGSGEVEVAFRTAPREVSVDTGSGDVTLTLPASWESRVEMETSSGDIHTDFRMSVDEMDEDHVSGRVGSGGGSLTVDTGSGDIRLVRG